MTEFTDERINRILQQYEKKRKKEKERYELIKDTEEFKNQNRERAKKHYENNKEMKKQKYDNDKEFLNARASYYYYKKLNRVDLMKEKHPEKVKILNDRNMNI